MASTAARTTLRSATVSLSRGRDTRHLALSLLDIVVGSPVIADRSVTGTVLSIGKPPVRDVSHQNVKLEGNT